MASTTPSKNTGKTPPAFQRAEAYGLRPRRDHRVGSVEVLPTPIVPDYAAPTVPDYAQLAVVEESIALSQVRRREQTYRRTLGFADMLAAAGSVFLAFVVIGGFGLTPEFLLVIPAIVLAAKLAGLYDHDELVIRKSTLDELPRLLNLATLFALLTWLARHYVVQGVPRTPYLLALWLLLVGSLFTFRVVARAVAAWGSPVERCLFVGGGAVYRRLTNKLAGEKHVTLVGSVGVEEVAYDLGALSALTGQLNIHRIIIATAGPTDPDLTMDLIRAAKATGLRVSLMPNELAAVGSSVAFDDLGGMPLLGVPRFGLSRSSSYAKRSLDLAGAAAGLLLFAPVIAVIAALIQIDSPGPILFRQTRIGRDGKPFRMLKFRTMVDGADSLKAALRDQNEASGLFKIADDPRMTRVGRFLRQTSLDEVPQLLNVLAGSMSLVGPRPLVVDEDRRITGFDRRRLHLTPGMTGRWQTLGSARLPLSEMVKIDYLYVANWSLWADIKILLQTVGFVLSRRGL